MILQKYFTIKNLGIQGQSQWLMHDGMIVCYDS